MLIQIVCAAAVATASFDPAVITAQEVRTASTQALAAQLLPPDMAAIMTRHDLQPGIFAIAPGAVQFYDAPRALSATACRRNRYYVALSPVAADHPDRLKPSNAISEAEIALSHQCREVDHSDFARVHSGAKVPDALAALEWLASQVDLAGRGKSAVTVTCTSAVHWKTCPANPQDALAALRLQHTFMIGPDWGRTGAWSYAVREKTLSPDAIGSAFWDVTVRHPASGPATIAMTFKIPAPF